MPLSTPCSSTLPSSPLTPPARLPYLTNPSPAITRIDIQTRLRRAIHLNDLLLVQRIVRNHPTYLQNPDPSDGSNTSLHLAARLGRVSIVKFLIASHHDHPTISLNSAHNTPLHLACSPPPSPQHTHPPTCSSADREAVVLLLLKTYPRCIPWRNAQGQDALMLACQHASHPLPTLLLATSLADPNMQDNKGNTALHHASAYGQLKTLRVLLGGGGRPGVRNWGSWGPGSYSLSVQAEVYWRGLVGEWERWVEGREGGASGSGGGREVGAGGGGVRLVKGEEDDAGGKAKTKAKERDGGEGAGEGDDFERGGGSAMGWREREMEMRGGQGGVGLGRGRGGRARAGTE